MAGTASSRVKRQRFQNRRHEMLAGGWIYYPERDLFIEKISTRHKRWTPHGQSQFLPASRQVYGREVFEIPDRIWAGYLEGEPGCCLTADACIGTPFEKAPSESSLYDPQGFALHNEGTVGR